MSWRLIAGFLVFYILNVFLNGIMEGGGGMNTTRLTAALSEVGTTITVANTNGFLRADYVTIGDEDMRYVSRTATTFTVATDGRGYNGTDAVEHAANAKVYSRSSSIVNGMIGFNVASTSTSVGGINFGIALLQFMNKSLPMLITWDFAHFRVNEWLQLLRYFFIAMGAAFGLYMLFQILSALGGVAQNILRLRP